MHIKPFKTMSQPQPSGTIPPRGAVLFLVMSWTLWLVLIGALATYFSPPLEPKVMYALMSVLFIPFIPFIPGLFVPFIVGTFTKLKALLALGLSAASQNSNPAQTSTTRQYSSNLGSTVLTILATVVVLPIVYHRFWYPDRIRNVVELSQDSVDNTTFPSITLFQRADWSSQANLGGSAPGKCFVGWHDETAPDCNGLAPGATPCQCKGNWQNENNVTLFTWGNTTFRTLTLKSTPSMVSLAPTTQMIVQTFFTFNSSKAKYDSSRILAPSLWIAVYDQALTFEEALRYGYTRMNLLDANGMVGINLGLNYKKPLEKPPAYDYPLSISVIPSTELNCDVSSEATNKGNCFLSLFLQFPTFDRLTFTHTVAMGPEELISAAGSWFALFQLAGWILSGLAFHP